MLIFAVNFSAFTKEYYVRTDGKDSNPGTSNTTTGAWKSIDSKVAILKPGDTLWIADGIYYEDEIKLANKTGSDSNRIVIRAINAKAAKICSQSAWSALTIKNCTGIIIQNIEIYFDKGSKNKEYCLLAEESNFVSIKNNTCSNAGCSGIQLNTSDNLLVEDNYVHDCASRNEYNGSGISVGFLKAKSNSGTPFAVIIRNNICHGNYCDIPFSPGGSKIPTDGNGIILDLWTLNGYTKAGLVENNLCFNNGGKGIHVLNTHQITVRNNTCWHNGYILKKYKNNTPELSSCDSNNGTWVNNIGVKLQDANIVAAFTWNGKNVVWTNNMFVGEALDCKGTGNIQNRTDTFPQFVNPNTDGSVADFRLKSTSPAINAGIISNTPADDLDGFVRPQGAAIDLGCYENAELTGINLISKPGTESDKIFVYPNPVTDLLNIGFASTLNKKTQLAIYDSAGTMVYQTALLSNNFEIQTKGLLKSGIYIAAINEGSVLNSVKFIVQ